jgi:hypothetical protein
MAQASGAWSDWLNQISVLDEFAVYPAIALHCRTSHKRRGQHWTKTAFGQSPSGPKAVTPQASAAA